MFAAHIKKSAGYTLLELMIIVAISSLLAGLAYTSFTAFSRNEALDAGTASIVAGLRDARARTLASVDGSQYGIYIEQSKYTLFKGALYDAGSNLNSITDFNSYIKASSTLTSIVFQRVTGNTTASGTIDVYLITDPSQKNTISVALTGLVDVD